MREYITSSMRADAETDAYWASCESTLVERNSTKRLQSLGIAEPCYPSYWEIVYDDFFDRDDDALNSGADYPRVDQKVCIAHTERLAPEQTASRNAVNKRPAADMDCSYCPVTALDSESERRHQAPKRPCH
jgi:hypothetical protein